MTFRPFHQEENLYFITASISGWKCLFYKPHYLDIILNSLDFLRKKNRHYLYSFVVMPNHVHFINKPHKEFTISDIVQNFSSYTAHDILRLLRKENQQGLITFFHQEALSLQARTPGGALRNNYSNQSYTGSHLFSPCSGKQPITPSHSRTRPLSSLCSRMRPRVRGKTMHKIWQDIQTKNIYSLSVLNQKMEYIHSNPCNKNWRLVEDRAYYKYSSACFYDKGIKPIIEIDNINELFK